LLSKRVVLFSYNEASAVLGQKVLVGSREAREETHGIVEYEAAKKERERGK